MTLRRYSTFSCTAAATILLTFLHVVPLAMAQPLPRQRCNDTAGNYTEGSTYQANIRRLADTLPDNTSSTPGLFAAGTVGAAPDAVYALALCRGDINDTLLCGSCVNSAFQSAQKLCALSKDATVFDEACILSYAGWDFLANVTDNREEFVGWNPDNVRMSAAFDAAARRLVKATAEHAAADAARRFASGEAASDKTTYPKIYSLAQCTPDMSAAECRTCLGDIIRTFTPKYFTGRQGGRVFTVRCNFRFETYPFFYGGPLVQLPGPPGPQPKETTRQGTTRQRRRRVLTITAVTLAAGAVFVLVACFYFRKRKTQSRKTSGNLSSTEQGDSLSIDSLLLDLSTLRIATDNFNESNKLGEGGFGAVYKGVLAGGQEIAVKRLSLGSTQGVQELKTEFVLLAKLQHKNLVRLVGVCLQENEKLLVYEYVPNSSLDTVIFDSQKSKELDWGKRLKIIGGVARGLQYLHEESKLKIVHRDLKPSNVLLDSHYSPKISDFGLAKLVDGDQSRCITRRIAGTYGYMAPEYAMRGHYSVKSDVFSLGVLILEIITGRKNISSLPNSEDSIDHDLLSLVWEHWSMGKAEEMLDPFLVCGAPQDQLVKLVNIGLLCVQDNPANRPMISTVNVMLSSDSIFLQAPSRPAFCIQDADLDVHLTGYPRASSPNEVSLSELTPR